MESQFDRSCRKAHDNRDDLKEFMESMMDEYNSKREGLEASEKEVNYAVSKMYSFESQIDDLLIKISNLEGQNDSLLKENQGHILRIRELESLLAEANRVAT